MAAVDTSGMKTIGQIVVLSLSFAALSSTGCAGLAKLRAAAIEIQNETATCEDACKTMTFCGLTELDACEEKCEASGAEDTPAGHHALADLARSSCDTLASEMKKAAAATESDDAMQSESPSESRSDAEAKTEWACTAVGRLETCDPKSAWCADEPHSMVGIGPNQRWARMEALSDCASSLSQIANYAFDKTTRVTQECEITRCWSKLETK